MKYVYKHLQRCHLIVQVYLLFVVVWSRDAQTILSMIYAFGVRLTYLATIAKSTKQQHRTIVVIRYTVYLVFVKGIR